MNRNFYNRLKLNKKGFTFVECIVAIAIFAIVGTLAFSMFNNSVRYMSKAKKEEAKLSEVKTAMQRETYMIYVEGLGNCYCIYPSDRLIVDYTVLNVGGGTSTTVTNYYIKMTYTTSYGDVDTRVAITPAPNKENKQPGKYKTPPYTRYRVLSDAGSNHFVYIYNGTNESEENAYVDPSDVYEDR